MKLLPNIPTPKSGTNVMITGVMAATGLWLGLKHFRGVKNVPVVASNAARAYAAETNPDHLASRIIALIATNAASTKQVYENMDRVVAKVASNKIRLDAVASERRAGSISPIEFRNKLIEIARTLATELGISLKTGELTNPGFGMRTGWRRRYRR